MLRGPQPEALAAWQLAGANEAAIRHRSAGRRLMQVEDNPVNQEVAAQLLRLVGLSVEIASNGAEAVERVPGQHHDLVLTDMQMPVMDGLKATRLLRERSGDALPIRDDGQCFWRGLVSLPARRHERPRGQAGRPGVVRAPAA